MPDATALDLDSLHRWRQGCAYPKADLPLPDDVLRGERSELPPDEALIAQTCAYSLGEPVIVEPLASGTFHRLWRVVRVDGRPSVFRANALPEWFRDYPLAFDGAIADRLKLEGLPFLAVHRVDWTRKLLPTDFAILDEAPGISLKSLDDDEATTLPLLRQLGGFLARLHRIRLQGFGLLDVQALASPQRKQGIETLACAAGSRLRGSHATWDDFIWQNLERHVRICIEIGAITELEGRQIVSRCEGFRGLFAGSEASLLHGDPGSHNVFVQNGKISALIDWEDALAGDPVYEIAFWATFHPERRHAVFLEGYRLAGDLPVDFEPRFWFYFLRVALAKTVLRHRLGIKNQPGREPPALRIGKALERLAVLGL